MTHDAEKYSQGRIEVLEKIYTLYDDFIGKRDLACMVSKTVCRTDGWAEMDDYLLSINTVFMQFIEHADAFGSSGNFIDLLLFMSSAGRLRAYKNEGRTGNHRALVANRPIEMIMLPPEYQSEALPVLDKLRALFQ